MIGNIISKTEILRKNEIEFEFALKGKWAENFYLNNFHKFHKNHKIDLGIDEINKFINILKYWFIIFFVILNIIH